MAERPDITELFTPEDYSAGLVFLRRILGCTFDYLWVPGGQAAPAGGSCDNTNDILAQLVTTLNWAMLAVIAVVATYLIFAALKDTANDGEAGGRSMNPSWTLVLAGLGAILCFPAFNGYSALQIGTMQVAVWSSGLGDSMWRIAGDKMASANAVNKTFTNLNDSGWWSDGGDGTESDLRTAITQALQARVGGELCKRSLNKSLATMATTNGQITPVSGTEVKDTQEGFAQRSIYFKAPASLNDSIGLCGGVTATYSVEKSVPNAQANANADPANMAIQNQIANTISKYAARTGKAGADAILTTLDTEAQKLTDILYPADGLRKRGPTEVDAIGKSIAAVVSAAKQAINTQFQQSEPELRQTTAQAMSASNRNGWFYAVLYQRILVNATSARDGIRKGISVSATPASRDLAAAWGCVVSSSWAFWKSTCSNELEVFFKQYSSDMANLDQMSGTFLNNANRDSGLGTNSSDIAAIRGAGMGWGRLTDWILGMMGQNNEGNSLNGEGWADPIPQLQTTGGAMLGAGGALVAAAKGGEILSESAVGSVNPLAFVGGKLMETLGPLGWLLVAIGFLLAVVVPYMPLIYFFLAALSWLILAVQTIITAPFWLMQMFYPNRHGGLQGTSIARALMVLLALLVRPALIIIGLIFCMMLMRVGLDFLNILTRNAYAAMAYAGPISAGGQLGNIALAIGGFMIYASAAVALVSICCGLIDGVGDAVMDGVEAGMSRFLGSQAQRGEGMLGNPAAAAASQIAIGGRGSLAGTGSQIARMRNQPREGLGGGKGGNRPPRRLGGTGK